MVFLQCVSAGAMFEHFAIYPEGGFAVSGPGTTEHYFFVKSGRKIELKVITLQYLIQDLYSDDFLFATPGSIEFLDLSQTDILQYLMALPSNKMLQERIEHFAQVFIEQDWVSNPRVLTDFLSLSINLGGKEYRVCPCFVSVGNVSQPVVSYTTKAHDLLFLIKRDRAPGLSLQNSINDDHTKTFFLEHLESRGFVHHEWIESTWLWTGANISHGPIFS